MILCIGTTPATQRVMVFNRLALDTVNRAALTLDGIAGKSINVAKTLKTLGEKPVATGFLGGARGEEIRQLLAAKQIEADFIAVRSPTRQCITVIDESASAITELVEESRPVAPEDFERLIEVVQRRVLSCRAVVMSGTITPGGPADFYQRCTDLARHSGALSVVDAQGPALTEALKARPALVKPNRLELGRTLGCELRTDAEVLAAMRDLLQHGAQQVVVTGGKGPTLALQGQNAWRVQPPPIRAVNPIGSGDAFTAGLTWRLLAKDDLGEACRWATAAGAANALSLMPGELAFADVERLAPEVVVQQL